MKSPDTYEASAVLIDHLGVADDDAKECAEISAECDAIQQLTDAVEDQAEPAYVIFTTA